LREALLNYNDKSMKKALLVLTIALMVITTISSIACGGDNAEKIIDSNVTIPSDSYYNMDLTPGTYDVNMSSDNGVAVQWIGEGIGQYYNPEGVIAEYSVWDIQVDESTTFQLYNPAEISAIVHLKIVRK